MASGFSSRVDVDDCSGCRYCVEIGGGGGGGGGGL